MDIKRNILFFPEKKSSPKGKSDAPIYYLRMRIRWGKNIVTLGVGHQWDPGKWNKEAQRCIKSATNNKKISASRINSRIQEMHDKAEKVFKEFEVKEVIPTKEQFREAFNIAIGKEISSFRASSFFEYFDEFTEERGRQNNWTNATHEKFSAVKGHLKLFNENLRFEMLDDRGLSSYIDFLRTEEKLRNSTIGKQLGFLKWFLRWASQKGYNKERAYESFKPKLKTAKKQIVYLQWDELMAVYNKEIPIGKKYLERVRDVFCFCCFTSLRYSDVANLKKHNILPDHIEITTVKTFDNLRIDLNDYSKAILLKYKDYEDKNHLALPVISNQRMNEYLKELGALCKLERPIVDTYYIGNERIDEVKPLHKVIGTHAGRRTFISNALILGIPAEVVMKWTGHSDYKAMKPYIEIADQAKKENMSLFNKR